MSEQRWGIDMFAEKWKDTEGDWIEYEDHVVALAEERAEALREAREVIVSLTDPVPDVERTMWTTAEVLAAIDGIER